MRAVLHDRFTPLVAAACVLATCLSTEEAHAVSPPEVSEGVTALQYGFFCDPGSVGEEVAPNTMTGTTGVWAQTPQFYSLGPTGPATLGFGFGVRVEIEETLEGYVTIHVEHPPHGSEGVTQESWETFLSADGSNLNGFSFDYEYEQTPGIWTFSAMRGETNIYKVEFEVLPDGLGPQPVNGCQGPVPLS